MKLRNKLILSCAALAAVATTAVSTTYAWYTSNQEVTAGTITGKTESKGDDLLLISRTGIANSWSASVDLSDIIVNLEPVSKDNNGVFRPWDANNNGINATGTATGKYISFDLYFKSGNTTNLNVRFKTFRLVNNTAATTLPTKSALSTTGLGNVGADYSVDLLRALTMEMTEGNTWEGSSASQDFLQNEDEELDVVSTAYQFDGGATTADSFGTGYSGTYNAHEYYNAVKGLKTWVYTAAEVTSETFASLKSTLFVTGTNGYVAVANDATFNADLVYYTRALDATRAIDETKDGTPASRTELFGSKINTSTYACTGWAFANQTGSGDPVETPEENTTGVSVLKVHFDIYLDGWDKACFDAVQGQNISLDMVFTSTNA